MGLRKEMNKKFESIAENTYKCSCGHSVLIGASGRTLCKWCGHWTYKDKKTEFIYKFKNERKKMAR